MKVRELITYMSKNTNKTMKDEQIIAIAKKATDVKSYLSIKDKKKLIDVIIDECILFEDGIFKFDSIHKYVCFTMRTLAAYTNLELSDDIEEDFDDLSREKLLPVLICMIQQEYDDVNIMLQMQCDYILEGNSVEAQIGRFLNGILDSVGSLESVLKDAIPEIMKNVDFNDIVKNKDAIVDIFKKY